MNHVPSLVVVDRVLTVGIQGENDSVSQLLDLFEEEGCSRNLTALRLVLLDAGNQLFSSHDGSPVGVVR